MTEKKKDISCAILAGGKASRMNGENKAFLRVGEMNNLERIRELSSGIFSDLMLITNNPDKFNSVPGFRIFQDIIRDRGPLSGIHSALIHSETDAVFFLPCDMPFISRKMIEMEIDSYRSSCCDVIVPRIDEFLEPLHSIYRSGLAAEIEKHFASTQERSVRSFYSKVKICYWDLEDNEENKKIFFNINTHHDLTSAKKMAGE